VIIAIADKIKPEAVTVVQYLKRNQHIKVIMLTGDNKQTANAIAKQLGIDQIFAQVRPEEKKSKIDELKQQVRIFSEKKKHKHELKLKQTLK